ncbi:hypothetical protein BJV82DRAFT_564646 [Fennellomyces sp. T-0311]|nr:hypothetical protein BJV82DRAFT_564646 [Fennellomyces sp. T-0311]
MPQSNQSPFLHQVFLPGLRSTLLALAVLAIGFGSWLETTDSIDSCSFRNSLALQKVSLLRNLSSDSISPDTVAFGLWKHCYIYTLNCTCTSSRLTYDLDAPTILEAAISNNTEIPHTNEISYWRVVPLAMATALGGIAFIFGVIVHRLDSRKLQWINAGIVLATTVLVAIGFGYTYHQYSTGIRNACDQLGNHCTTIHNGVEFIVLVAGLALIGVSVFLWAYAPVQHDDSPQEQGEYSKGYDSSFGRRRETSTSDVLEPWRDATLFDDKWRDYRPIEDHAMEDYNVGPLPPPPSNRNHRRSSHNNYYEEELVPPSRPFVSSARRASHGSGNTFGANNMLRNSRTSSVTMDDHEYYYSSDGSGSPTRSTRRRSSNPMSPHPPTSRRRSNSPYARGDAATPASTHPLNRKVITDKRISEYLHQQRHQ